MSEKPHSDVSRETPEQEDSELTPEQIMLNDIMDRAMAKNTTPPEEEASHAQGPGEAGTVSRETPEDRNPPAPPEKNKPSSVYIYLAVMFGAAFLMLLLAYFVQQRNSDAVMDDLRLTTASREELLEDIKTLEEENEDLQKEVAYQKSRVTQVTEERDQFRTNYENYVSKSNNLDIKTMTLQYFWYIDQFMQNKDYPMAAAAVLFQADSWRDTWNYQFSINSAQVEQYESYRQELIERGYLEERPVIGGSKSSPPTELWFTEKWDPSQRDDMAALCNLWCALNAHFITENDHAASQYLSLYPLGTPSTGYQKHVEQLASSFTLEQFQLLKDELVEVKWLEIAEDGTMSEGFGPNDVRTDELYTLPFNLPATSIPLP